MIFKKLLEELDDELYFNVVKSIFPNLNEKDAAILNKYLVKIINHIAHCFGCTEIVNNTNAMIQKLRHENYKDCVALLYMLLPFINDESDKSKIRTLNEIYTRKKRTSI